MTAMVEGHHHNGHTHSHSHSHSHSPDDVDLLRALTASSFSASKKAAMNAATTNKRPSINNTRRPQLDPLILETAASSGPHVTRNHFLHEFYPHPEDPSSSFSHHHHPHHNLYGSTKQAYASCDVGPESDVEQQKKSTLGKLQAQAASKSSSGFPRAVEDDSGERQSKYQSRQAPRKIRLEREKQELEEQERLLRELQNGHHDDNNSQTENIDLRTSLKHLSPSPILANTASTTVTAPSRRRSSATHSDPIQLPKILKASQPTSLQSPPSPTHPQLRVICHARTRVPTPHGEVYLHLYKNNMDDKEHLAFVFDREQLAQDESEGSKEKVVRGTLRSKSLDSKWREGETDIERIVRGAYVGRLSSASAIPSSPLEKSHPSSPDKPEEDNEPVLIRVHSECFTGETIGSQRCDCGEQLDEAFRLISSSSSGLGIIVYLRQEGRGIGLLEKIKAYNLQDLGHDTVSANLLLGHNADLRSYGIAGEILRDLSVGRVRLLTNNPDKIESVEKEGIKVVERVAMVPRGWGAPAVTKRKSKKQKKSSKRSSKKDQLTKQNLLMSTSGTPLAGEGNTNTRRLKNKNLDLHPHDGTQTPLSQVGITDDDEEGEGGSYHFPSAPGSRTSFSDGAAADLESSALLEPAAILKGDGQALDGEQEDTDATTSSSSEEEDDDNDEEARQDFLMAMNRTGVGMIGAGTTHSKELEKYLKTKVERMGHLLVVPNTPPSTPIGGIPSKKSGKNKSRKV